MERLKKRYENLTKATEALEKSLNRLEETEPNHPDHDLFRDSTIQRFEFSFDTSWKFLKGWIETIEKLEIPGSPRGIFKVALDCNIITMDQYKKLLEMLADRNNTSHTYNEELAIVICKAIPTYYKYFKTNL